MDVLLENHITTLDFNLNGETIAFMDRYGTCVLSDVNTHNSSLHLSLRNAACGKQKFSVIIIFQHSHSLLTLPEISADFSNINPSATLKFS